MYQWYKLHSWYYRRDSRSDWFEGVLEAVRLLVAVPSSLTRTGEREREREREREKFLISCPINTSMCNTPDNITSLILLRSIRNTQMGTTKTMAVAQGRTPTVYTREREGGRERERGKQF